MGTPNRISGGEAIAGKLVTNSGVVFGDGSYQYLAANRYWGSFFDTTTQSIASTTTSYPIALNNADSNNFGVSLSNGSRINFTNHATYNVQFSLQFANTDTQAQVADVWFAKNGTNVADTNSRADIPSSHGGVSGKLILALNVFVTVDAGDYIQLMWSASSTLVSLITIAEASSPTRPRTPSVIVTVTKVDQP